MVSASPDLGLARGQISEQNTEIVTDPRQAVWIRGLFMILFMIIGNVAAWLIAAVAVFQFLFVIITGKQNPQLASFAGGLSRFVYQIAKFLTFGTEEKPFPFTDWPGHAPGS